MPAAPPHLSKGLLALLVLALPLGLAAGILFRSLISEDLPEAAIDATQVLPPPAQSGPEFEPQTVEIPPHKVSYRPAGWFSLKDAVVDAPLLTVEPKKRLHIMRHQVTAGEFAACVAEGACKAAPRGGGPADNLPAVKVSWEDATAYAAWLTRKTGKSYRLPTDEEWLAAAGSRKPENAVIAGSAINPAARWLAEYEAEANRNPAEFEPKPLGAFGINEYGVADLAGNVWEWTDSCFVRASVASDGQSFEPTTVNCGVRVLEGQHRAYLPNFVRDAKGGACSTGKPPSNLGFRLVRVD